MDFAKVQEFRADGLGPVEIAEKLNVAPSTIYRHLHKHGITVKAAKPGPAELLDSLSNHGHAKTAETFGVSLSQIARWLKGYQADGLLPKKIFYAYRHQGTVTAGYKSAERLYKEMPPAADIVSYLMDHTFLQAAKHYGVSVVTFWRWTRYYRDRGEMV